MSFISGIGKAAGSVGSAIGAAAEDVAGAVGDAAGAVNKALGGVPGEAVDGAVDLVKAVPNPVQDALKSMAVFAVATPALGLGTLAAGAVGAAAAPQIPAVVDKLEGKDLKDARATRANALTQMNAEAAKQEESRINEERQDARQRKLADAEKNRAAVQE